jgi:hypothetical protein
MNLAVKFDLLKNTQPHYSYTPESCLENDNYKLYSGKIAVPPDGGGLRINSSSTCSLSLTSVNVILEKQVQKFFEVEQCSNP